MTTEARTVYQVARGFSDADRALIAQALAVMERQIRRGRVLDSPHGVGEYLALHFAGMEIEQFVGVMVDSQHRVIATVELARGTIDAAAVYPREVVKAALAHNAAAVIFSHNHPSGQPEPSSADRMLTDKLRQALALVDVRTLDHIVIGGARWVSFAERGWL